MPNDAAALIVDKATLSAFDGIVLVIAADFLDTLVEDHKIVDQIKETFFVKQRKELLFQLAGNPLAVFLHLDVHNIAFLLVLGKAIVLPFQIVLLRSKQRTIT